MPSALYSESLPLLFRNFLFGFPAAFILHPTAYFQTLLFVLLVVPSGPGGPTYRRPRQASIYSVDWSSASNAGRSQRSTVRPSILMIPSDCSRERLRETSSRTVPICAASS